MSSFYYDNTRSPGEPENVESDNAMYVGFIKLYAPVLNILAKRVHANNIVHALEKVKNDTHSARDIDIIQRWIESSDIDNEIANFTPDEITQIINDAKNAEIQSPEVVLYEDAIGVSDKYGNSVITTGKRGRCLISYDNIGPKQTCVNLHGHEYSVYPFEKYYDMEKAKKRKDEDYTLITPMRNPINEKEQRILDQFYASLKTKGPSTRHKKKTHKKRKNSGGTNKIKSKSKSRKAATKRMKN